jgi:hypothetical protein
MEALKRLGHGDLDLDEHERMSGHFQKHLHVAEGGNYAGTVANEVIHPDDITTKFSGMWALPMTRSSAH